MLNGLKAYDPDGDPITFSWRQIQGPAIKLDDATSITPSFISPTVLKDTNITFQVIVKDDKGAKNSSIVTITDKHNMITTTNSKFSN